MRRPTRLKQQTRRVPRVGPEIGLITENVLVPIAKPMCPRPSGRPVSSSVVRASLVRPSRNRTTPFLRSALYYNHQEWNQVLDNSRIRPKGSTFSALEPSSPFPNSIIQNSSKDPKDNQNSKICRDCIEILPNFIDNPEISRGSRCSVEEFPNSGIPGSLEELSNFGTAGSIEELSNFGIAGSLEESSNTGIAGSLEEFPNSTNPIDSQNSTRNHQNPDTNSNKINSFDLDDSSSSNLVNSITKTILRDGSKPGKIFDLGTTLKDLDSSRIPRDKDTNTEKDKDFFSRTILKDKGPADGRYSWQDIEDWHKKIGRTSGGRYPCTVKYSWQVIGRAVQTSTILLEDLVRTGNEESGDQVRPKYSWQIIGTGTQTWQEVTNDGESSLLLFEFPVTEERPCGRPATIRNGFSLVLNNQSSQTFADKGTQASFSEIYGEICKRI